MEAAYQADEITAVLVEAGGGRTGALSMLSSQLRGLELNRVQFETLCTKMPLSPLGSPSEWSDC